MAADVIRTWNLSENTQIVTARFVELATQKGFGHNLMRSWPTEAEQYQGDLDVLASLETSWVNIQVVDFDKLGIAKVEVAAGSIHVDVCSDSRQSALQVIAVLEEAHPQAESKAGSVPVTFWYWSRTGPDNAIRHIAVPTWDEVESNYPPQTRAEVAELMLNRIDIEAGQLILWQGDPGTGKTYGLRTLMDAWREWADFHFIVDPEHFFGEHTDYMMQVLLRDAPKELISSSPYNRGEEEEEVDETERWKVLVLEDSGEMLAADAKQHIGQALSRLLNIVDGIIGQGLRVLILVTTNEELKSLHPAIQRPGRCASQIMFHPFSKEEGQAWMTEHDGDPETVDKGLALSWLYALLHGQVPREEPALGFTH